MTRSATKRYVLPECQDQQSKDSILRWGNYPLEINSGAIQPSGFHKDVFSVQANTSKGLLGLYAVRTAQVSEDEFLECLETLERRHRRAPQRWSTRSTFVVTCRDVTKFTVDVEPSPTIKSRVAEEEEILDDWRSSPAELLAKLLDSSSRRAELFEAILFAEIAKFDESQTEQLLTRLLAFVSEYRLSQDDDVKTAVGAAIRKLAMNLRDSQVEEYADLLLPTETETLPCEIELELAKAIVWRLTSAPASLSHKFPKLETRLAELASDYLRPRLILHKNYSSIALQAALGVLLLNGQHANSVLKGVKDLGVGWFTDLFRRRLERLRTQLVGDAKSTAVASNLARFQSELQAAKAT